MRGKVKKIVAGRASGLRAQAVRYLIAGTIAFVVDFALLKTFTEALGIHYLISAVIGYCAGLAVSYLLSILWVFDKRRLENKWAELFSFAMIGAAGLGLTSFFMWLLTDKAGIFYLLSKIITTVLVFTWNFAAKKVFLFSK